MINVTNVILSFNCLRGLAAALVLSLLMVSGSFVKAQSVYLSAKVNLARGGTCSITVYKSGTVAKRIHDVKRKTKVELEFDEDYVIVFKQKGYRIKSLAVSTKNVPVHMREELLDFAFEVVLDQPELHKVSAKKAQLVAYWFYSLDYGEFQYTYNEEELQYHEDLYNGYRTVPTMTVDNSVR